MDKGAKEVVAQVANLLVESALTDIAGRLQDDVEREDFIRRLEEFSFGDISEILSYREYVERTKEEIIYKAEKISTSYVEAAISDIISKLPDGAYKESLQNDLIELSIYGISAVFQDYSIEQIQNELKNKIFLMAKNQLKRESIYWANQAVDSMAEIFKEKGRGSGKSRKNRHIKMLSTGLKEQLESNISQGVDALWRGENFCSVGKQVILDSGKGVIKNYAIQATGEYIERIGNASAKYLKTSGKGSRTINKQIEGAKNIVVEELTNQFTQNALDVIDGRKNVGTAVKDVALTTAKNSGINYVKGYGAEIAAQGIKELSKVAEKNIKNELARNAATKGLGKLANANTIIQAADVLMEIGESIKRVMNGEITKAEFLREIGERGTALCVSSVYSGLGAMAGMALGGPLGAMVGSTVGSMVGYISSSILYGSVLKAFEDVEESRRRYEFVHEFCETSIRQMELERQRFVRETEALFKHRDVLISDSFDKLDRATKSNDFEEFSKALNQIGKEFGKELQFSNMKEFDEFMSDEDTVFEL